MIKVMNKDENEMNLDVYINGYINLNAIPTDKLNALVFALENEIVNQFNQRRKRKTHCIDKTKKKKENNS